ncbi:MAG: beta-galactosidase, partial [Bacteroidaceae bacterium]|nr:beta-galactosidase [Bacteroidaceae bacterium]
MPLFLDVSAQSNYHIWEDQHVLSQHREAPRADFTPFYQTKGDRELSLDGLWKFNWTRTPDEQPTDFYALDFNDSAWKDFPVPGDWEVNAMLLDKNSAFNPFVTVSPRIKTAYGTPIYSSSGYTFKINPPYVMTKPKDTYTAFVERNPTGCYRRWVTIPTAWQGKTVHLRIGSASSAVEVYANGKYIGYSQGTMEPAEFIIPTTENRVLIALKVYKYCDGSYLEDQDQWRLGGLHRSVTMYATEPLRIRDLGIRTTQETASSWLLNIHPDLSCEGFSSEELAKYSVTANLFDASGSRINAVEMSAPVDTMLNINAKGAILNDRTPQRGFSKWGWMSCKVDNPQMWSAETPYLYTLRLCLKNKESGEILEQIEQKVGFRDIKIKDGQLLVNGKSVRLRGVNRHEFSATLGKVMTEADMLRDILLMKQGNVNAVRTCHYPDTERWYELCDSIGLYVMDEVDIEEHGLRGRLAQEPEWTAAWLDRTQ